MADTINKIVECEKNAQQIVKNAEKKQKDMYNRLSQELKRNREKALSDAERELEIKHKAIKDVYDKKLSLLLTVHNTRLLTLKKKFDDNYTSSVSKIIAHILQVE